MQRIYAAVFVMLLSALAVSQTSPQPSSAEPEMAHQFVIPPTPPVSTIKGIKIIESGLDAKTNTFRLVFMNDRATNITAYHYCVRFTSVESRQAVEGCKLVDALRTDLETQEYKRRNPRGPEIKLGGPGSDVVHPGEKVAIEERTGDNDAIVYSSIYVDEVAWSDDTFEGSGRFIMEEREAEIKESEFVSRTVKDALSSSLGPMLVTSVIATLQAALQQEMKSGAEKDYCNACSGKRIDVLIDAIASLERPGRYTGGGTHKFIPDNQSKFLAQFLIHHEAFVEESVKHVTLRRKAETQ